MQPARSSASLIPAVAATVLLAACGGGGGGASSAEGPYNQRPPYLFGDIGKQHYDGQSDDLLTAGLGQTGLAGAAPAYANPLAPTAAELRRNAIYNNYRALVDPTPAGGFGTLFGPAVDVRGQATLGEGKIPGTEYIVYADPGSGHENVTLMVQVPDRFDAANPCIVTGTSSGSRGIYGAIGTSGDWGLKHGCAVAYTDKGTGNGIHALASDQVTGIDGVLQTVAALGKRALFQVYPDKPHLDNFRQTYPHHVAYKHAHSQNNPEKDWGRDTLRSVEFALYVLNEQLAGKASNGQTLRKFTPQNTLVIASSVSNGAGAALAAAEQDTQGLIDGVAVSEPQVQLRDVGGLSITQGNVPASRIGSSLVDYFTYASLYQPCAALAQPLSMSAAFWPAAFTTAGQNRCTGLKEKGLLTATTLEAQASEALQRLHAYGWGPEHDFLHQSHYRLATNAIAVTYVNAAGRFRVQDQVCGFSFANTDATGKPVAQAPATLAGLFASGNGVPPTSGVNIVYNPAVNADGTAAGPVLDFLALSPSTRRADFALDGALCLRAMATGIDPVSGQPLTGTLNADARKVRKGISEVQIAGTASGKPTLVVAGRNDALIPPNHASRAYIGKGLMGQAGAPLRYVEVTNAQHFDSFLGFGPLLGYDTRFVPLHYYFNQAMDAMYAHLRNQKPLPDSQVIRTTPRAAGSTLTSTNLPAIAQAAAAGNRITFSQNTLRIPQ